MDDGYKSAKGVYIATESYTYNDVEFLCKILKNKFSLECSPHLCTNGYRLYIFSSSKDKLIQLVKPCYLEHFYYKLELDVEEVGSKLV
jgi:hypothetical protein